MADVKLTVKELTGVTPIGVTITYALGSVPVATVELAPDSPGVIEMTGKLKGTLTRVDKEKRKVLVNVDLSVTSHTGIGAVEKHELVFKGMLDGVSISNVVGGNAYHAILKGPAQKLLELTTLTPGLYPSSINIYKNPVFNINADSNSDSPAVKAWGQMEDVISNSATSPIEAYTNIMRWVVHAQSSLYKDMSGTDTLIDGALPFQKIYEDKRYKGNLQDAKILLENVDYSAVSSGSIKHMKSDNGDVLNVLQQSFIGGPTNLLENYLSFLATMGCSLIFGNEKIFVVPINSVLEPSLSEPGVGQTQKKPNRAYPADYNSYVYNDNGYRDIAHVLVMGSDPTAGIDAGGTHDPSMMACVSEDPNLSSASGVLVIEAHPWMTLGLTDDKGTKEATQQLNQPSASLVSSNQSGYAAAKAAVRKETVKKNHKDQDNFAKLTKDILENYAASKFYQMRYGDRTGTITMSFNPNWVPGTGGVLYVRETKLYLAFYVTSVTHRAEMSSGGGSAVTTISFCCGRLGRNPPGVAFDKFLGYTRDKEEAIQAAFIKDISK